MEKFSFPKIVFIMLTIGFLLLPIHSNATLLELNLNGAIPDQEGNFALPDASLMDGPWLSVTFYDNYNNDDITDLFSDKGWDGTNYDLDNSVLLWMVCENLTDPEMVAHWWFNYEGDTKNLEFFPIDSSDPEGPTITFSKNKNQFEVGVDNMFNIEIEYPTWVGQEVVFGPSDPGYLESIYLVSGVNNLNLFINEDGTNTNAPYDTVARIINTGLYDDGEAIIAPFPEPIPEPVPEPASILLLSIGFLSMVGFIKREKK